MVDSVLKFEDEQRIGMVASVDTNKALVRVTEKDAVTQTGVGNLLAIKGATEFEYLIGIIDRVTRNTEQAFIESDEADEDELQLSDVPDDAIRVALIGTYRTKDGDKANTFKRGADSFPQIDRNCFLIYGENLQSLMNLLGAEFKEGERLSIGHYVSDLSAEAIASGDKFFQRHASIVGSTGSGKSWCVARLLEQAAALDHSNLIVFDMHGEYSPLAKSEQGAYADYLRIAGPGDLESPDDDVLFLPYWLLGREEMLSMFLDRSDDNAPNQASRFTYHVRQLKAEALDRENKEYVKQTFTVDSPIPYQLQDLLDRLNADNTEMVPGARGEKKGDWNGKLTRFLSRLSAKIEDRRYGFLFQPSNAASQYDWLNSVIKRLLMSPSDKKTGIKVIDFSEVPPDVLPVVTAVLARLLYNVQFWVDPDERTPFAIACDEAHLYLPVKEDASAVERQALGVFERIAKEGRKYGTSLVVISQRPSDVSRTILSQCNNFIILRLTNDRDRSTVQGLVPDSLRSLTDSVPLLDIGECVFLGDAVLLPTRIKITPPSIEPASSTRPFWREWNTLEPSEDALLKGIEAMRRQSRS